MKRLMLIIPSLDQGGAEKQLTLLASQLPRDQFNVSVCALTRGGPYESTLQHNDVPVTVIGKKFKVDPLAYGRLKQHIQQQKPDLVHTWLFAANSYGRRAAQAAGTPHIICGERCVDRWKAGYEHWIDKALDRRTDRIACNSSGIRDFYVEHGRDADKFRVIPNGMRIDPAPPTKTKAQLFAELGIPEEARLMVAVGRLWPQKRVKDLIWAVDILRRVRDDAHLLIVGDGPQSNRLRQYARQVTVNEKVHFAGHRGDVREILTHADLFFLASGYEGQSNALMEAMAAGVPPVVSDIAGNRDLVRHEENGYLVGVGQRAEYARFAQYLLEDDKLRAQLGAAARATIARDFTIEAMVQGHVEMYQEVAGR